MILRSIAVGVSLLAVAASPALAADTWHWGSIRSADHAGRAAGTVVTDGSGYRIKGRLYDLPHRAGCSWLTFRWRKLDGHTGYRTFHTCVDSKPLAFSFTVGPMHGIEGRLCRGTAKKATGRCSLYEGVWAEGG